MEYSGLDLELSDSSPGSASGQEICITVEAMKFTITYSSCPPDQIRTNFLNFISAPV